MGDVALLDLNDRTLHVPGPVHGYARCGTRMNDPWVRGPSHRVAERARQLCPLCFPEWANLETIT